MADIDAAAVTSRGGVAAAVAAAVALVVVRQWRRCGVMLTMRRAHLCRGACACAALPLLFLLVGIHAVYVTR